MHDTVRSERDRLDVGPGGDHGEHRLAGSCDLRGRSEQVYAKTAGMGARALAARVSDDRVTGGEQVTRELAAHVAEADESESHGFSP